jgi:hypothetical protein
VFTLFLDVVFIISTWNGLQILKDLKGAKEAENLVFCCRAINPSYFFFLEEMHSVYFFFLLFIWA